MRAPNVEQYANTTAAEQHKQQVVRHSLVESLMMPNAIPRFLGAHDVDSPGITRTVSMKNIALADPFAEAVEGKDDPAIS